MCIFSHNFKTRNILINIKNSNKLFTTDILYGDSLDIYHEWKVKLVGDGVDFKVKTEYEWLDGCSIKISWVSKHLSFQTEVS